MPLLMLFLLAALPGAADQFQTRIQEAVAALDAKDYAKAQASLVQATELEPKDAGAWLLLAQAYAKQNQKQPALAAAAKAENLGSADPNILQGLANFYASTAPDLPKAASLAAMYAEKSPQDTTAWLRLTAFCVQAGLPDQAIAAGTRALAVEDDAEGHALLGQAYLAKKDFSNAAAQCREVIKLRPYDEQAHFRLAQVYLLQQDFNGALGVLLESRKTFDRSPQLELALGVTYYGLRQFPNSIDQFLKTIALAPDVAQPYAFLGRTLDHAGERLPEITQRFASYQARNPENYFACVLYAKALIAQLPTAGESQESEQAFGLLEKALKLKPDDAEAHYLMGVLLERKGAYDQARVHFERSIELNAADPAPHFHLARVYLKLGRREDAEQQRAIHEKLSEQSAGAGLPMDAPAPVTK